ncbi:MAG: AMP-binding protein, partial [Alphaproteobacteria bacterium]|nr:AMP-binding protein [Alphaproteobacteria bacterium]
MYLTQSIKTNAQTNRHGIATICGERRQSWGSFAERVARLAGALRDLGVGAGDRVAILALNCDRYLESPISQMKPIFHAAATCFCYKNQCHT